MKITPAEIEKLLQILAETPHRIASVSRNLENAQLHFKPDENVWSANDILAHLRSCGDVWGKSIQAMLTEDTPTLRYVSPRTWIKKTNYPKLEFRTSFQIYIQQRDELLSLLNGLTVEEWSRGALIKEREETVFSYARRITQHEQAHCEQIEVLLKSI
jgi:hypothetical protein